MDVCNNNSSSITVLWCEASGVPCALDAGVLEAFVESGGAALPELDAVRDDHIAAPVVWAGYRARGGGVLGLELVVAGEEVGVRAEGLALGGCEGAELVFAGTARPVGIRFGVGEAEERRASERERERERKEASRSRSRSRSIPTVRCGLRSGQSG